jgi:hypothetical protein
LWQKLRPFGLFAQGAQFPKSTRLLMRDVQLSLWLLNEQLIE